jgi:hypothetical protein
MYTLERAQLLEKHITSILMVEDTSRSRQQAEDIIRAINGYSGDYIFRGCIKLHFPN